MSRSNWKGTAGWGAIADPTQLMTGNVLVATAGVTAVNEDYLQQIPSTGATFSVTNYSVRLNYAFPTYVDTTTASNMSIGLMSRTGAFGTSAAVAGLTAQSGYIGRLNQANGLAEIIKRDQVTGTGGVDTILHSAILPSSAFDFGVLHTLEFKCIGDLSSGVTLELSVDNSVAVSIGDLSSSPHTSGYAGIQIMSGTTYADNFSVLEYTSSGSAANPAYSGWILTDDFTAADLKLWIKTDAGVTTRTDGDNLRVQSWVDQSGNSNTIEQATATAIQPRLVNSGNVDGSTTINAVRFEASNSSFLYANASDSLNIYNTGNGVTAFFLVRAYQAEIGQAESGADDTYVAPLMNFGRSYQLFAKQDPTAPVSFDHQMEFTNGTNTPSSNANIYSVGQWNIIAYVNGSTASSDERGFFKDGTQWSTTSVALNPLDEDTGRVDSVTSGLPSGTGYSAATAVSTTGGTGSGLTVDTTVVAGQVTAVSINNAGAGYSNGDTITITGGGGNATFVAGVSKPMVNLRIGRRNAAQSHTASYEYGSFDMIETILIDKAVTVSERQKIEGYLAWKYGLSRSLPASHPYKNQPPTT